MEGSEAAAWSMGLVGVQGEKGVGVLGKMEREGR